MTPAQEAIWQAILAERARQNRKFGDPPRDVPGNLTWLRILMEEVGEVAQELDSERNNPERLRTELVQVVASGVWWLEQLETPTP